MVVGTLFGAVAAFTVTPPPRPVPTTVVEHACETGDLAPIYLDVNGKRVTLLCNDPTTLTPATVEETP
jgi:hypothetical protein